MPYGKTAFLGFILKSCLNRREEEDTLEIFWEQRPLKRHLLKCNDYNWNNLSSEQISFKQSGSSPRGMTPISTIARRILEFCG